MKQTELTEAIDRAVAVKMKAIDKIIEELVEPLADVGNPEKLIKKPYESWTPEDLTLLSQVYGEQEPNPLSELIFRKSYDNVKKMEAE